MHEAQRSRAVMLLVAADIGERQRLGGGTGQGSKPTKGSTTRPRGISAPIVYMKVSKKVQRERMVELITTIPTIIEDWCTQTDHVV